MSKIISICKICGKEISSYRIRKVCNAICQGKLKTITMKEKWIVKVCLFCNKEFSDRPNSKRRFCSNKCGSQNRSKIAKSLWKIKNCEKCGKKLYMRPKNNTRFCSYACLGSLNTIKFKGKKRSKEFGISVSKGKKGKGSEIMKNVWKNNRENMMHGCMTIKKIRENKTYEEIYGENKAEEIKLLLGRNGYKYKRGYFYSEKNNKLLYYRSSFEETAFRLLENFSFIKRYDIEPYKINYEFCGKLHYYIPDILITYNNDKQELVEIKPKYLYTDEQTKIKFKVGQQYAKDKKIDWSVWDEDDLSYGLYSKEFINSWKETTKDGVA